MQNYKELKVWEKAHHFTLQVYEVSKAFPKDELCSLTNQLRRAASPMPANEVEYFLILSKDLTYLKVDDFMKLSETINEIKAMLIALINKVRVASKT